MIREGTQVFCLLKGASGQQDTKICGVAIEILGADAIVACSADLLPSSVAVVKREEVGFLRLPISALVINRPKRWPKDLSVKAPADTRAPKI